MATAAPISQVEMRAYEERVAKPPPKPKKTTGKAGKASKTSKGSATGSAPAAAPSGPAKSKRAPRTWDWKKRPEPGPIVLDLVLLTAAMVRGSAAGHPIHKLTVTSTCLLASGILAYVDQTAKGLEIRKEFGDLKDFVGKGYTGTLGAGLTILQMIQMGYPWHAHFEDGVKSFSPKSPCPDFYFANDSEVALTEAKASGGDLKAALAAARKGLNRQVLPAAKHPLKSGGYPTIGFSLGTSLNAGGTGPVQMAGVFAHLPPPTATSASGGGVAVAPVGPNTPVPSAPVPSRAAGKGDLIHTMQKDMLPRDVELIVELNYLKALRQLGFDTLEAAQTAARQVGAARKLVWGPAHQVRIGPTNWEVTVVVPLGVVRVLAAGELPKPRSDLLDDGRPSVNRRLPKQGGDPEYIFVNFPDHVSVVLRPMQATPPADRRDVTQT